MNAVIQAVNPLANQIIASVLNSVWQGAAMALMVWVLLRVLKRLNAATRYAIWCGSLFSVVALTCLGVAHVLHNRRPGHVEPAKSAAVGFVMPASGLVEASAINELNVQPEPKTRVKGFSQPRLTSRPFQIPAGFQVFTVRGNWAVLFVGGWVLVSALLLGRLMASCLHLRKLKRASIEADESIQQRFRALVRAGGIARPMRLLGSRHVPIPVALGLSDPVVLIPAELPKQLETMELDQILLHEAAHLARRDDWSNLAQQVVVALFWFNPAVLWISRQLSLEREIACDDRVTLATGTTKPYALCLTKLAELTRFGTYQALASGAWVSKTQLSRRISMLLDNKQNRTDRVSIVDCVVCLVALSASVLLFSQAGDVIAAEDAKAAPDSAIRTRKQTPQPDLAPAQALSGAGSAVGGQGGVGFSGGGGFGGVQQGGVFDIPRRSVASSGIGGGSFGQAGLGVASSAYSESERDPLKQEAILSDLVKASRVQMLQQNQLASRDAWKELTDEERQRAAQLRDQVAASLLATLKGQTNSSLRVIAMNSLVGMQPDKATVELLVDIALQDKEPEVRRVVLSNLFRQFSAISSERLLKLYDAEDATEFKSAILKRVSSRLSDDAKGDSLAVTEKWVAKLQQIATESPSPKLRAEAILLLGQVGSNFRKLSPADEK